MILLNNLKSAIEDGDLKPEATIRKYRIVQAEGTREARRLVDHYSLDVILSVGFRVRSK